MVYTLAHGADNYNKRTHYSLYGGVEHYPDRAFAWKELLPLVAVPVVSIALLAAVLNFHVPRITPTTGASGQESNKHTGTKAYSLVLTPSSNTGSRGNGTGAANGTGGAGLSSNSFAGAAALAPLSPIGSDNGQGIVGGMGGGGTTTPGSGGTTTVTDPTGTTTTSTSSGSGTTSLSVSTATPVSQTDTSTSLNTSTGTAQVGVDVFLAPTATSLSAGASLTP